MEGLIEKAPDLRLSHLAAEARVAAVRLDWFERSVRECQILAGNVSLLLDPREQVPTLVGEFVTRLPEPANRAEELILQRLLLDVAAKLRGVVDRRAHSPSLTGSYGASDDLLSHFGKGADQPARQVFLGWVASFHDAYWKAHPLSPSQEVAATLRRGYSRSWRASDLAGTSGLTAFQLRRAFRLEHGMAIAEYYGRVRLMKALERLIDRRVSVEGVAHDVGYLSKKNFYRTLRKVTALTPTEFRQLPRRRQLKVIDSIALSLTPARS